MNNQKTQQFSKFFLKDNKRSSVKHQNTKRLMEDINTSENN